jgi:uncharacterized protein
MIVYLHGFRSSPRSFKARLLAQRMDELGRGAEFGCPALPPSPRQAIETVQAQFALTPADTLIGSSLGGCYATWLAERHGCRAVLLNPAVRPARDLVGRVGTQTLYHDPSSQFEFLPEYIAELQALQVDSITQPQRYLLVAATGDELLDWREMLAAYPGAHHRIIDGGDHGLTDFAAWIGEVLAFAGIAAR